MNYFQRAFNIVFTPEKEWKNITSGHESLVSLFVGYVLPMVLLGSLALFIGYGFIGYDSFLIHLKGINWGWWFGIRQFVSGIAVYFISSYVIDALATFFASTKNLTQSARLVAYSSTPFWISIIFKAFPLISFLSVLGLYGVYLFYLGLPVLKNTHPQKRVIYMLVSAIIIIVLSWIFQWITGMILNTMLGDPYAGSAEDFRNIFNEK